MQDLSDDHLCLVGLSNVEGVGAAALSKLRRAARERGMPLCAVVELSARQLEVEVGLTAGAAGAVTALADPILTGWAVLERVKGLGGRVLLAGRPGYPRRLCESLGERAPPVLFVLGEPSILDGPCVAVVGSRRPSRGAARGAEFLSSDQAAAGATVVSGGARGIDTTAHRGAAQGGATAVVPAMGLKLFRWSGLERVAPADGRWCAVGQFPLCSGWQAAHALVRNRTVVALSDAVVAFEPRDRGGTWRTCVHALQMRRPLFVATASRHGEKARGLNRLVRMGAVALDAGCLPGATAFARLVSEYRPPPGVEQIALLGEGDAT